MDKYINLVSLVFNMSWVTAFTYIQTFRGAYKHYVYGLSWMTALMLFTEMLREMLFLFFGDAGTQATPFRVWIYGAEHVLLGMVFMEALHYVEICRKHRKRSRRIS